MCDWTDWMQESPVFCHFKNSRRAKGQCTKPDKKHEPLKLTIGTVLFGLGYCDDLPCLADGKWI
jgi:hypothetical protein